MIRFICTFLLIATLALGQRPTKIELGEKLKLGVVTVGGQVKFSFKAKVSGSSGAVKEDLYLLTDATGSMSSAIRTSRRKFRELVSARSAASSDVAFGVGFYRDERDVPFKNLQSISTNATLAQLAIEELRASGGLDHEEANLYALLQVATQDSIGWRPDSRRILVYFGDQPGHEPTCPGGKPLVRDDVIKALQTKNIIVVASSFRPGLDAPTTSAGRAQRSFSCGRPTMPFRGGQATDITSATGGKVVDVEDQEKVIDSIIGSVKSLPQILDIDTSKCDEAFRIEYKPSLPIKIAAGTEVKIKMKIGIKKKACMFPKPRTPVCFIKYTLDGAVVAKQPIFTNGVMGC